MNTETEIFQHGLPTLDRPIIEQWNCAGKINFFTWPLVWYEPNINDDVFYGNSTIAIFKIKFKNITP